MSQTSYSQDLTAKCPGKLDGVGPHETVSRVNPSAPMGFGHGAQRAPGADDEVVKVPDDITHEFAGVVVYSHAVDTDGVFGSSGDGEAPTGQAISVLKRGRIYVAIDEDVDPDAQVHLVCLAAGGDTPGHFRATADGVNTVQIAAGAKWDRTDTAASGVGCLVLNLPQ